MKKSIYTPNAPAPIGPYSQAIATDCLLFCSGQIPVDPVTGAVVGTDVAAQTEQVMKNIGALLAAAGKDYSDVVKTTCFLTTMNDFAAFNAVYAKYFGNYGDSGITPPARSTVAVAGLPKNVLVEVEVVAK